MLANNCKILGQRLKRDRWQKPVLTGTRKKSFPFPTSSKTGASIPQMSWLKEIPWLVFQVSSISIKAYTTFICPLGIQCSVHIHSAKVLPLHSPHETQEPSVLHFTEVCSKEDFNAALSTCLSTFLTDRDIKPTIHAGQSYNCGFYQKSFCY